MKILWRFIWLISIFKIPKTSFEFLFIRFSEWLSKSFGKNRIFSWNSTNSQLVSWMSLDSIHRFFSESALFVTCFKIKICKSFENVQQTCLKLWKYVYQIRKLFMFVIIQSLRKLKQLKLQNLSKFLEHLVKRNKFQTPKFLPQTTADFLKSFSSMREGKKQSKLF